MVYKVCGFNNIGTNCLEVCFGFLEAPERRNLVIVNRASRAAIEKSAQTEKTAVIASCKLLVGDNFKIEVLPLVDTKFRTLKHNCISLRAKRTHYMKHFFEAHRDWDFNSLKNNLEFQHFYQKFRIISDVVESVARELILSSSNVSFFQSVFQSAPSALKLTSIDSKYKEDPYFIIELISNLFPFIPISPTTPNSSTSVHDKTHVLELWENLSLAMKNNREVFRAFVMRNSDIYKRGSEALRMDEEISLAAALTNSQALKHLPRGAKNPFDDHRNLFLQKIREADKYAVYYECGSIALRANEEIAIAAALKRPDNLRHLPLGTRNPFDNHRDLFLKLVKRDSTYYKYGSDALRADQEIALAAALDDPENLTLLPLEAQNPFEAQRELYIKMMSVDDRYYRYGSPELRGDAKIALAAALKNPENLKFLSPGAKNPFESDLELYIKMVKQNKYYYIYGSETLKKHPDVIEAHKLMSSITSPKD